ncbi:keratin-associated protein 9-1-like [Mytilus trossulus]|uniref:keratin-associated protein 9-1-like n=1 Tax=Mytilus trossulus TaxID=6551 RepID=UPI003007EFA1
MKFVGTLLFVGAVLMTGQTEANVNCGCIRRGGKCSNSSDCPTTGGEQMKLNVNCRQAKACCKCTDMCPKGSSCIPSNATCDGGLGNVDSSLCCGDQVCCTPCFETSVCKLRGEGSYCQESCNVGDIIRHTSFTCCGQACCVLDTRSGR